MSAFRLILIAICAFLAWAPPAGATLKLKSLCEIHYPSDDRTEWTCEKLNWQDTPNSRFGSYWQDVLRFNRLDRRHFLGGRSIKLPKDLTRIYHYSPLPLSYPEAAREPKFILIDQAEMFLGAYEYGRLVLSFPAAIGIENHRVPTGDYQVDAADRSHQSNLYQVEEIDRPYPMHYGLRFFVDKTKDGWPSYWIHGRDLPGYPASHGCVGLYDEEMQVEYYSAHDQKVNKKYYHPITPPYLEGAQKLYQWVVDPRSDPGTFHLIGNGAKVKVIGEPPI
ncbi:transpeptidase [Geomonas silvestris]|uniref:Transpeptidase n=1 Tax=Geomonas silvestris TaxID=2740184 RepID=A0A6V8MHS3_9BACT|nr:L,D-transpeptidase [Geomonas silvestris]GFO59536.1 transpeptidase [Geomonas silvestris]